MIFSKGALTRIKIVDMGLAARCPPSDFYIRCMGQVSHAVDGGEDEDEVQFVWEAQDGMEDQFWNVRTPQLFSLVLAMFLHTFKVQLELIAGLGDSALPRNRAAPSLQSPCVLCQATGRI